MAPPRSPRLGAPSRRLIHQHSVRSSSGIVAGSRPPPELFHERGIRRGQRDLFEFRASEPPEFRVFMRVRLALDLHFDEVDHEGCIAVAGRKECTADGIRAE